MAARLVHQELAQVVLYERTEFGGLDPLSEEYALLVEIADGMTTFADAGLGEVSTTAAVDEANLAAGCPAPVASTLSPGRLKT